MKIDLHQVRALSLGPLVDFYKYDGDKKTGIDFRTRTLDIEWDDIDSGKVEKLTVHCFARGEDPAPLLCDLDEAKFDREHEPKQGAMHFIIRPAHDKLSYLIDVRCEGCNTESYCVVGAGL